MYWHFRGTVAKGCGLSRAIAFRTRTYSYIINELHVSTPNSLVSPLSSLLACCFGLMPGSIRPYDWLSREWRSTGPIRTRLVDKAVSGVEHQSCSKPYNSGGRKRCISATKLSVPHVKLKKWFPTAGSQPGSAESLKLKLGSDSLGCPPFWLLVPLDGAVLFATISTSTINSLKILLA